MPQVPIESLPDDARVWIFGSERDLTEDERSALLADVDRFLAEWAAHGTPLTCARDWRHDRFLAIAVDQHAAHASGCSIDGLYRSLRALEPQLGTTLLGGGRVFYRAANGGIQCVRRAEFAELAERGEVDLETAVFDLAVSTLAGWRARFELPAGQAWQRMLVTAGSGAAR